jgi:DNA-binding beta-propeller fold protein YncE
LSPSTYATVPTVPSGNGAGASTAGVDFALSPNGKSAYATNESDDTVSQYTVLADGDLQPMVTPTLPTGPSPDGVAVSPTGTSVYVLNEAAYPGFAGSVSMYTAASNGSLTPKSTATIASGAQYADGFAVSGH